MWLILQIFVGITLAFIALVVVAAFWWHATGRFSFDAWWLFRLSELRESITVSVRDAMCNVRKDAADFRNSVENSAAAINEGLHQNAASGRIVGAGILASVAVTVLTTLAERLFLRRQ